MTKSEISLLFRAVLFGITLTAIGLVSAQIVGYFLQNAIPGVVGKIVIGLSLFVLWLVHGGVLRSLYRSDADIGFFWLWLSGIATILGGTAAAWLLRNILLKATNLSFPEMTEGSTAQSVYFVTGLAFALALITAINLKVKIRFLGNFLEFILLVVAVFWLLRLI